MQVLSGVFSSDLLIKLKSPAIHVGVLINDSFGPYFNTQRGVRQGDPLSPLLFNIAVDALSVLIKEAQRIGLIKGITPHLQEHGIAILQYADDTIFLLEEGDENARNLKFILCLFEQLSGLKINFLKSEVFCLGKAVEQSDMYSEIFTCQLGVLPMKYLGIPIDQTSLQNKHWKFLEDKIEKKMSGWQGKVLSIGGRTVLLNACLSSVPFYMLSFYRLPKGVCKRLDYFRSRLLWQEDQGTRKYHLVNWQAVCTPKELGGLGVLDLDMMNVSLLCKWLWKLENTDGAWQRILRKKYLQKQTLSQAESSRGTSQFWSGLMKVKDLFYNHCTRILGSGKQTRFWEDVWYKEDSLDSKFSRLYNLCFNKNVTVHEVISSGGNCLRFRRCLWGNLQKVGKHC